MNINDEVVLNQIGKLIANNKCCLELISYKVTDNETIEVSICCNNKPTIHTKYIVNNKVLVCNFIGHMNYIHKNCGKLDYDIVESIIENMISLHKTLGVKNEKV